MTERIPFLNSYFLGKLRDAPARWLTHLIIAGMVFFSAILPFMPGQSYLIYLLALVPALFLIIAIIHWPGLGLVALIIASLVVPFAIGTGSETTINASILLLILILGLWGLDLVAKREQIQLVKSRTMRPLVILLVVIVISFLVGQLPWFTFARQTAPLSAQLGGLSLFFLSVSAFVVAANQVRETKWLEWMTWVFIGLGTFFVLGEFVPFIGSIRWQIFQGGATGAMFWIWMVALAFSQALINTKLGWGWRLLLAVIAVATLYVGYSLNDGRWKSGYIPPIAAIATIILFRWWRIGIGMALIALALGRSIISNTIAADQYSYSTRVDAGLIILEIVRSNPILGFGPSNYYWYTPLFPIRGYEVEFNSHNQYLDIVAQIGFLGLLIFFWFMFEVGQLGFRLRNRVEIGFEQAYVYGALGGLVGTLTAGMLADWIIPFVYNVGFDGFRASVLAWIFLGGLVSLEAITRRRAQSLGLSSRQAELSNNKQIQ